jgi:PAS domain-containing protein
MHFDLDRFSQALTRKAADAIIYADATGLITFWNEGAERIFSFSRHWDGHEMTMRTGKTRYRNGDLLAVPVLRKDRTRISIEFTILPFQDNAGHILGIAGILRDVTNRFEEMKKSRAELAALRRPTGY